MMTLPLDLDPADAPVDGGPMPRSQPGLLLVGDDPFMLDMQSRTLRSMGYTRIDDFGTGHSSLAQLRDVPFTELKIDRGFVHGARQNQLIRPILEGSIGIAQRLGLQTVAEGVETEDDWALLRAIGCDIAQGYFIGRPMPGDGLQAWLADWLLKRPRLIAL